MKKSTIGLFVLAAFIAAVSITGNISAQTERNSDNTEENILLKLPELLNKQTYTIQALPDFMDDIWVIDHKDHALVFTDKRNGLQGIADINGNVLMDATCPLIFDWLYRFGRVGNENVQYSQILCGDGKEENSLVGYPIDLNTYSYNTNERFQFQARGYNTKIEYHDGLSIVVSEKTGQGLRYGYMDQDDNIAIDFKYKRATVFNSGYATVYDGSKWNIIEKDGSMPFKRNNWQNVQQVNGRTFIGKYDESWYFFELPASEKKAEIVTPSAYVLIKSGMDSSLYITITDKPVSKQTSGISGNKVGTCKMKSHLKARDHAEIINTSALKLRKEAAGEETGIQAFSGKGLRILDGPVCREGVVWFEVEFLGHKGWVVEVTSRGNRYLEKVK